MGKDKLTNNEELVLRLLYSNKMKSKDIPVSLFDVEEKDRLLGLKLLTLMPDGYYELTNSAISIIENGGFIIKYPMFSEQGVVLSFAETLKSYSKPALKALSSNILSTKVYKIWGKDNNIKLYEALKDTMKYYDTFGHPLTRAEKYRNNISEAQSEYEKLLLVELSKIEPFKLTKPISLGMQSNGVVAKLIEFIDIDKGVVIENTRCSTIEFIHLSYRLTPFIMHEILQQAFVVKSRATKE